jgi:FkbM family methyltransferase
MLIDFNKVKEYGVIPNGVFHVGMHKAEEYKIYKDAGVETICFVEANEQLAHSWRGGDDDEYCYVVHAAVSDKVEEVEFNITNNGESSSILELGDHATIYPHIVYIDKVKMKTTTIDSINRRIGWNEGTFNIFNLDIQGAELKALRGIGDWRFIEAIFTEVNYREMYKGCASSGEMDTFLKEKGFVKVEEVDTGAGWGDALYVKEKCLKR